jgi:nucleoside-diphosphate-sugar epimerase
VNVFVTGATGFVMGAVARALRARGDHVTALVREPSRARSLATLGCELIAGDVVDPTDAVDALRRSDALIHGAAIYEIGVSAERRRAMEETNVTGTRRMLEAAGAAGTPRIVYVSTIAAFGNTRGAIVAEGYLPTASPTSAYEDTKRRAHEIAVDAAAKGAPIVIVQPGGVYGPGDHSELGNIIGQTRSGKLFALPFAGLGMNLVYVDDVAEGILLAHDKGRIGESYALGGEIATMRDLVQKTADLAGRKPPKREMPTGLIKAVAPAGPLVGKLMGFPPNFRELISASDGVTYWAKDDKARSELGYSPRDLDAGLRQTLEATA